MNRKWTVRTNDTQYSDIKTYTVLEPNPDHNKSGVCYSGEYFTITVLDSQKDAQLISAAPDMYEALKDADNELCYRCSNYKECDRPWNCVPHMKRMNAINKAEGLN